MQSLFYLTAGMYSTSTRDHFRTRELKFILRELKFILRELLYLGFFLPLADKATTEERTLLSFKLLELYLIRNTLLAMGSCCSTSSKPPEVPMTRKFKELESAHWVRKMRTLFRTLDTDGDGFITLEDNQASPKRMTEYFNLSKEKADAVLEYTRLVGWVEFVNAGIEPPEGHRVSEQTFIENIARAVNSKEDVAKHLAECHICLFDLKEPGFLSKEEYLKIFGAQGVAEEISAKRFEMLDSDKDDRITLDDYTQDIRFFFTDLGDTNNGDDGLGSDQVGGDGLGRSQVDGDGQESKRVVCDGSGDETLEKAEQVFIPRLTAMPKERAFYDERNHPHRNNIFGELI